MVEQALIRLMAVFVAAGPGIAAAPPASMRPARADAPTQAGAAWDRPLMPVFRQAASEYNVPLQFVLALAEIGSRFEDRGDTPSLANGYGLTDLTDNEWGGQTLPLAARLTGVGPDRLKGDPAANVRGAAAVLDEYARQDGISARSRLEDWLPVLIRYAGLDADCSRLFARGVYQRIRNGFDLTNTRGERFVLSPQRVDLDLDSLIPRTVQPMVSPTDCGNPDYAGAIWDPAPSCNYGSSYTNKDTVVIHVAEGSAAATINWFKNCSSGVSTQYVVDSYGTVWQMVCEKQVAYHAVCYSSRSIGLEHEGYSSSPSFPEAMYQGSANLVRDVCNRWGIPKEKARQAPGVLGHRDVTECAVCGSHTDPGPGWNWGHYIALLNQTAEPATFIVESRTGGQNNASYSDTGMSGNSTAKSILWDSTAGIGSRYGYTTNNAQAVYRFTPATTGTYAVYVTWPQSTNTTAHLTHIVTHAGGSTSSVLDINAASNPCGYNNWNKLGEFVLDAGTQYTVTQDSSSYHDGLVVRADAAKWVLVSGGSQGDPPAITQHPSNQVVAPGGTAAFAVAATGTPPLTYQWQKNLANLTDGGHYSGCTTASLTIADCDAGDAGSYRCRVSNAWGTADSDPATLTVSGPVSVFIVESRSGGQNFDRYSETGGWSSATCKSSAEGCTAGIGSRFCTIGTSAGTAIFSFTPTTTGTYEVFTTNCSTTNSGNPLIHKVAHAGGTATVGVCQNSGCTPTPCNAWVSLGQYTLNAATPYTVTLDGYSSAGSLPTGYAGRSDAVKWEAIQTTPPPTITQHPAAQNVCPGATATFTVAATGEGTLTYQWQKNAANLTNGGHYSGATTVTLTVSSCDSSDAASYRCVVTNAGGSTPSNAAALTLKAATAITQHPANRSVPAGWSAAFSVAATGEGTLTYQWQKNGSNLTDGGHHAGTATATLTVSNCDSGDEAGYRCAVTGECGTATSNAAALAVTAPQAPGDFDADTDVDLQDFSLLQKCLGIADPSADPFCAPTDLNADNAIDYGDVTLFVGCLSGPEIAGDPGCISQ